MFPGRYFAAHYFSERYWPVGSSPVENGGAYFPRTYFPAHFFAQRYWPIGMGQLASGNRRRRLVADIHGKPLIINNRSKPVADTSNPRLTVDIEG